MNRDTVDRMTEHFESRERDHRWANLSPSARPGLFAPSVIDEDTQQTSTAYLSPHDLAQLVSVGGLYLAAVIGPLLREGR